MWCVETCTVKIIPLSITNKMQRYTIFFITINALHVSGGFSAHHQVFKTVHSIWYMSSLLAATASVVELQFGLRWRNMQGKGLSTEPCEWGRVWLGEVVLLLHPSANQTDCFYSQIRLPYSKVILLPSNIFFISKTRKIKLSLGARWSHIGEQSCNSTHSWFLQKM
jgi:hypothetical protein